MLRKPHACLMFAVLRQPLATPQKSLSDCSCVPIAQHQTSLLLCRIIKEAFYLARTGRPGPVLVDVPKDIQQQLAVPDWSIPMAISGYMSRLPQPPQERELKRVIDALHGVSFCPSQGPVLYAWRLITICSLSVCSCDHT